MLLTENLAYITGFLIGDGNLSKKDYLIRAVEKNEDFIRNLAEIFEKVFKRKPKIYFDRFNNSFVLYIHSKFIWSFFVNELKIPAGRKAKCVQVPLQIMNARKQVKIAFLRGIFDAEGSPNRQVDSHHPRGYPRIELKVCSEPLIESVSKLLHEIGVYHRLYHYDNYSLIGIYGRKECEKYLKFIGFYHPDKIKKLKTLLRQRTGQGVCPSGEAKEFKLRSRSESDKPVARKSVGRGVKAPGITRARPEAGRSTPRQGEVPRKRDGGPLPVVRPNPSGDLGVGVKLGLPKDLS